MGPLAHANTGISIEAVDTYPNCNPLTNNKANADGFRNQMLSVPGYTTGNTWFDGNVWPIDFNDPEILADGDDTNNFDRPDDAIAYFSGHGSCDNQTTDVCSPTMPCAAMPGLAAVCTRFTEAPSEGRCMYSRPRSIITQQTGTSTCQTVNYSTGPVRWGESPVAGWAGAGTNGNINLAVIDNSCGITPDLYAEELTLANAGISTIALIMPTRQGDDTVDIANRGRAYADRYVADAESAVGPAWTDAINAVTGGTACEFGGGEHGIGGCGAHIAISADLSEEGAVWANRTETWTQLRDENNDANGNGWLAWILTCNYDCLNHPWRL